MEHTVTSDIMWATTWQNQQNEYAPSENSDQPGHPPRLIRVFAVCMKKPWVLSYPLSAQRRFRSDWADAQADLSLRWEHSHFVGFVMSWHMSFLDQHKPLFHNQHAFRSKLSCETQLIQVVQDLADTLYHGGQLDEPHRDKTNEMACASSEDSDQPGHPPSLIRVFAVRLMGS